MDYNTVLFRMAKNSSSGPVIFEALTPGTFSWGWGFGGGGIGKGGGWMYLFGGTFTVLHAMTGETCTGLDRYFTGISQITRRQFTDNSQVNNR